MRTGRVGGALVLAMAMVVTSNAGASSNHVTSDNLECATNVVSTWSVRRMANETIAVPVSAMGLGGMVRAARAGFGGMLLFGARGSTVMPTTLAALQRMTPGRYSMLVMTDEEGGGVERLTNLVASFPWAQSMGASMSAAKITALARRVGGQLSALGVNTDLAPVLDVDGRSVYPSATNPDGLRSFGGVPSLVAADGVAFAKGLRAANVTAVVKHFPGLGHASGNTDFGPAQTLPWSTLQHSGLVPFARAINDGASAVMLSNAEVPGLSALPASISSAVISVLRQVLNFHGLIMTDSLSAGAISALHLSVAQAAVKSLAAGADLVLFGSALSASISLTMANRVSDVIVSAVRTGALARMTLVDAAAHVLATRNTVACLTTSTTSTTSTTTITTAVYLVPFYRAEVSLAHQLLRLRQTPQDRLAAFQTVDWPTALTWLQSKSGGRPSPPNRSRPCGWR